jgi:amidophosphoribosyltransferase
MGLVHEVLAGHNFNVMSGNKGIGHVRYSTSGSSCAENCQPIVVTTLAGDVALAHNGDIVNADKLRQKLQSEGWAFLTTTDSEIIIRMLATELSLSSDPIRAIKNVMKVIEGAYSLTIMIGDRIFGIRDPLGFRPLCLGRFPEGYSLASESAVFDVMGGEFVRDIAPGEIVEISQTGFVSTKTSAPVHRAHCMFEWVYFARPDSVLDGKEVYQVRKNLGHILAREQPVDADVVVAVPDSGRAHALGFAEASGIPYEEGFMKNRYVERTFIMPEQTLRDEGVLLKLNPIISTMKGKRVVIVDDSIVRGTTMRKIVQMTRRAGAREVHVRIGCPPIIAPCYYGIDMKTRDQFAAVNRTSEDIARLITADSVGYTSMKGLVQALEIDENDLCLACINGEYPTTIAGEKLRFQKKLEVA